MNSIRHMLHKNLCENNITAVWGAGAKGSTFVNLFDKKRELIRCLVDINERKQNRFVAHTGHMIINPSDIGKCGVKTILVMNGNYYNEIKEYVLRMGYNDIKIVSLDDELCEIKTIQR